MANALESMFGRLDGPRRLAIIAVGVVVTAAVFGLSRWATAPDYVPLYSDLPMEMVSTIEDKLTEQKINYRLERGGSTIAVASKDVASARVALAREPLPNAGRPGLELFDKPTWGMTDFTQKVNYRRALEGELERNISAMQNVERVQVHLALEDDKLFKKDTRQSKASVTLAMRGGESPAESVVRGIASLVAGSVGGLDAEHVVIVDERGNAMTTIDDASGVGLSSRQLAMQQEVEQYLEQKAQALVSRIVGAGNARVQVAASVNFDKVERTTQSVNPDQQVVSTEQKAEITPQAGQAGAASTNSTTTFETSRSVESFTGSVGDVRKMTVAVLVADRVVITPTADGAEPIAPTFTPRTDAELAQIESLVRNALGVDSARGDGVSVISAPFDMPVLASAVAMDSLPPATVVTSVLSNPKPVVAVVALLVLLVLALVMVKALRPVPPPPPPAPLLPPASAPATAPATATAPAAALNSGPPVRTPEPESAIEERKPIVLPPPATSAEREQAAATVEQRPDAAVRVTRSWLRN